MSIGPVRIALAVAVAAAVTACSGPATSVGSHADSVPASYYLAVGDSLSQGVQPDAAGTSVPTGQGYPDQLYAALHRSQPALQLVKLGCPGETTATMIHGGTCRYRGGSQLAGAVACSFGPRGPDAHSQVSWQIAATLGGTEPIPRTVTWPVKSPL